MNKESFKEAIKDLGACPCDTCLWHDRCASQSLACWDFTAWVATGSSLRKTKAGEPMPPNRRPRKFLFDRLIKEDAS